MNQYVYLNSEPGLYTVGFYNPDGEWVAESDHKDSEQASERVHYLNGGSRRFPVNLAPKEKETWL